MAIELRIFLMPEMNPVLEDENEPLKLVSQSGLAKILGVSKQRVSQMKDAGLLPTPYGTVDSESLVWTCETAEQFAVERNQALGKISLQE